MDTSHDNNTPSPPAIDTAAATSISSEEVPSPSSALAASTLSSLANASTSPSSSPTNSSPSSAGPLKKRRKVGKQDTKDAPTAVNDDTSCTANVVNRKSTIEGLNNMESAPTSPSNKSLATQFPSMLHGVLGRNEPVITSSVEWLSHGRGFRVLRWDRLCTEVLPKEFSELCDNLFPTNRQDKIERRFDSEGKPFDSREQMKSNEFSDDQWVEAFLWHIRAWGFQEVMTGKDRGSFRHEVSEMYISYYYYLHPPIAQQVCSALFI